MEPVLWKEIFTGICWNGKIHLTGNRWFYLLHGKRAKPGCWKNLDLTNERSTLEIDFVIQKENVYPIEVKAEENLRSKSLRTIVTSGNNLTGWRFSMSDFRVQDWMINIPLYLVQEWVTAAD